MINKIEKIKKEINSLDINSLIEKSKYNQSLCINKEVKEGVYSHLLPLINKENVEYDPDNWDVSKKEKKTIFENEKALGRYAEIIWFLYQYKKEFLPEELLPPHVVFPLFDGYTINWKMGIGERYVECYFNFLLGLDAEKRKSYLKKYPEPEYFRKNILGLDVINYL